MPKRSKEERQRAEFEETMSRHPWATEIVQRYIDHPGELPGDIKSTGHITDEESDDDS